MKQCSSCGETFPFHRFRADKRASDGLRSQCVHCESAVDHIRYLRWRARDPEAVRQRNIEAGRRYRQRQAEMRQGVGNG